MATDGKNQSFADLFESEPSNVPQRRKVELGERVGGRVVQVGRDAVFVELDAKRHAFFHAVDLLGPDGTLSVKVGDALEGTVVELGPGGGEIRLGRSLERAGDAEGLRQALESGVAIDGKVTGVNKGGLEVDLGGVRGFCPISQADRGYVADPNELVGRTLQFQVTEIRDGGRGVVVSRRAVLDRESKDAAERALGSLSVGTTVRGTVTGVRDFGAFVDLGGVEGLIPASQLSHDRGVRPADVVTGGDVVEVQVKEVKRVEPGRPGDPGVRITLSLKALAGDPWDAVEDVAPVGRVVRGTVSRLLEFGAFVKLASGIEGLLHVSELPGKPEHPSRVLSEGETVTVVVKSVDAKARRIGLTPAPDDAAVGAAAPVVEASIGSIVTGTVERHEPYGVFVQLKGTRGRAGRGLVPNAELGTARGADKRKELPLGTEVTAKVLETGEGRLRLSISAVHQDRERSEFEGYRERENVPEKLGTLGDLLKKKL